MIKIGLVASVLFIGLLACHEFTPVSAAQTPERLSVDPAVPDFEIIDLSDWVRENSKWGITSFHKGELFMRSKLAGYYYVLVAPEDYSTERATTSVTVRNLKGAQSRYGYGLIFHSNPIPLQQDYAFVIDSVKKRFRVIRHVPNDEKYVIRWGYSAFINSGRQENTLQVRDLGDSTELYINGHLVTTVENTYAFKPGSPGLYTDTTNVAFSQLKIDHHALLPHFK